MVITLGDPMMYKLVSPDFTWSQRSDFSQQDAIKNANRARLFHAVKMDDCSVNTHTAHDDRMLQHMAYFEANVSDQRNRIRAAIVCRWLGPLKYYRTNYNENDCLRHSLVDPVAFENLDKRKHAVQWWRMMGYQPADLPWMELPSKCICYFGLMLSRLVLNMLAMQTCSYQSPETEARAKRRGLKRTLRTR